MFSQRTQANAVTNAVALLALMAANLLFNVVANASFKVSATSPNWRSFLTWQVIGNLAGFITVLTLTGLLRFIPLHVAYPVTVGLAVIGVQVGAVRWLFHLISIRLRLSFDKLRTALNRRSLAPA